MVSPHGRHRHRPGGPSAQGLGRGRRRGPTCRAVRRHRVGRARRRRASAGGGVGAFPGRGRPGRDWVAARELAEAQAKEGAPRHERWRRRPADRCGCAGAARCAGRRRGRSGRWAGRLCRSKSWPTSPSPRSRDAPSALSECRRLDLRHHRPMTSAAPARPRCPRRFAWRRTCRSRAQDSGQYAVTARGFNNAIGNKLLVLIDGRTIYASFFSGVLWDQQDLLLDDVERIEVISGPGGTLWGTNAVNGVINVVTKSAAATTGTLASASVGNQEKNAAFRYGWRLGDADTSRLFAKRSAAAEHAATTPACRRPTAGGAPPRGSAPTGPARGDTFTLQAQRRARASPTIAAHSSARRARLAPGLRVRRPRPVDEALRRRLRRSPAGLLRPLLGATTRCSTGRAKTSSTSTSGTACRSATITSSGAPAIGGPATTCSPASSSASFRRSARSPGPTSSPRTKYKLSESAQPHARHALEHNDFTGTEVLPSARLAWKASADDALVGGGLARRARAGAPRSRASSCRRTRPTSSPAARTSSPRSPTSSSSAIAASRCST